jgi:hypothetical protein
MTIKDKFRAVFVENIPKDSWMTQEEYDSMIEESVKKIGGWDKIEEHAMIGVSNGYTIEEQIEILNAVCIVLEQQTHTHCKIVEKATPITP